MSTIEPKLPGGFRDYLPEDMIPRQKMLDTIRMVFERFGFAPLDTPGVERTEILTGGDAHFKKQIYGITHQGNENDEKGELSLRFDLTVPLARVVAANSSTIKKPFKRYQVGKVWRGERQQAGRYREFVQCDADIVGAKSIAADADIVALMYETMKALGITNLTIRVNNRKILNGLADYAKFGREKTEAVLRALDKLDKLSWDEVAKELSDTNGAHLSSEQIDAVKRFATIKKRTKEETIEAARNELRESALAQEGLNELEGVATRLRWLGVPDEVWTIDLAVARGLGYYTGTIYETILNDLPQIGSVCSGGRYDDLVSRFSDNSIPAVGTSIGVDRLFAAMEQLKLVAQEKSVTEVFVLNFDATSEADVMQSVSALRAAGVNAEYYVGSEDNLKGQLAYAVAMDVPIVVIIGENESKKETALIKNMKERTQEEVSQKKLVEKVKEVLKK